MGVPGADAFGVQPRAFFTGAGWFTGAGALGGLLPPERRLRGAESGTGALPVLGGHDDHWCPLWAAEKVQIWPLGFGAADKPALDAFAAAGAPQTCNNLPDNQPHARIATSTEVVAQTLLEAIASANCATATGFDTGTLHGGGQVETAVDIPKISTDGVIVVLKGDPRVRVSYIGPTGREVSGTGTFTADNSTFTVSTTSGTVETLRIRNPRHGEWKVRLGADSDVPTQPVAAAAVWQRRQGLPRVVVSFDPPPSWAWLWWSVGVTAFIAVAGIPLLWHASRRKIGSARASTRDVGSITTLTYSDPAAPGDAGGGPGGYGALGGRRGRDPYENAADPYGGGRLSNDAPTAPTADPYTGRPFDDAPSSGGGRPDRDREAVPRSPRPSHPHLSRGRTRYDDLLEDDDDTRTRRSRGRPGQGHMDADSDERVRLDVRARMDSVVGVGEVVPVTVLLSRLPVPARPSVVDASGVAHAAPGVPVVVEVVPRVNFAVVGPAIHETAVPDPEQSDAVVFHVRATHAGYGTLWVVVRQESEILLEPLVLTPEIIPNAPESGPVELTAEGAFSGRETPSGAPALHMLRIHEERDGERTVYRYDLEAHDLRLLETFTSEPVPGKRDAYVRGLYKKIEECWVTSRRDEEKFDEELREFGADLLDELVPPKLQRVLWENRRRLRDILVLSTEPFIPWELVHLKDPDSGRLPADETCFLGQLGVVPLAVGSLSSRGLAAAAGPGLVHNPGLPGISGLPGSRTA